jgi:uncharacterized small protein (DUF1192 family)
MSIETLKDCYTKAISTLQAVEAHQASKQAVAEVVSKIIELKKEYYSIIGKEYNEDQEQNDKTILTDVGIADLQETIAELQADIAKANNAKTAQAKATTKPNNNRR